MEAPDSLYIVFIAMFASCLDAWKKSRSPVMGFTHRARSAGMHGLRMVPWLASLSCLVAGV